MAKPSETPAAPVNVEELTKDWPAPLAITSAQVRQAGRTIPVPFLWYSTMTLPAPNQSATYRC